MGFPLPSTITSSSLAPEVASLVESLHDTEWREALSSEWQQPYFAELSRFVVQERSRYAVYPPKEQVFEAFNHVPLRSVKVVLLGQDPYHGPGQAHGLSFSVPSGVAIPPSLKNIHLELENDIKGFQVPSHGSLMSWAAQGVFMLNASLTVRAGQANSHSKCGWQRFTDAVIRIVNERTEGGVVFMLWGNFARKKGKIVDRSRHAVVEAAHPSPLSARLWRGCHVFSKCNDALRTLGRPEVNWLLE